MFKVKKRVFSFNKKKKAGKLNAVRTTVGGKLCDSKLEGRHYNFLIQLEKEGKIKNLFFHPKWEANVCGVPIGTISLDFSFFDTHTGKVRHVDSKGLDTASSKWKRKHLEAEYGIKTELWLTDFPLVFPFKERVPHVIAGSQVYKIVQRNGKPVRTKVYTYIQPKRG